MHPHMPELYRADSGEQIEEPAYRLLVACFFDETYWQDGEVLVTDLTPNHHMEPLNRAADERIAKWLGSLPGGAAGSPVSMEDMMEAAMMLRPREGEPELSTEAFQTAVVSLAIKLKEKRQGKQGSVIPGVRPANASNAPPMPNAQFNERGHQFGHQEQRVTHQPSRRDSRVRSTKPAMGGVPPAEPAQRPEA